MPPIEKLLAYKCVVTTCANAFQLVCAGVQVPDPRAITIQGVQVPDPRAITI